MAHDLARPESLFFVEIKNKRPVELTDLTESLQGLAAEYERFIERESPDAFASDVRLYVDEIKTGSIIATIAAASPQLMQGISYVNTFVSFSKFLGTAYDWLTGKSDKKPGDLDKATLQNLSKIVEPVAKDNGSQINLGVVHGPVYINCQCSTGFLPLAINVGICETTSLTASGSRSPGCRPTSW